MGKAARSGRVETAFAGKTRSDPLRSWAITPGRGGNQPVFASLPAR